MGLSSEGSGSRAWTDDGGTKYVLSGDGPTEVFDGRLDSHRLPDKAAAEATLDFVVNLSDNRRSVRALEAVICILEPSKFADKRSLFSDPKD